MTRLILLTSDNFFLAMTSHIIANKTIYIYKTIYILRLSGKQDDSLERQSDSSESWSDILERQKF